MGHQIEEYIKSAVGKPILKKIFPEWLNMVLIALIAVLVYIFSTVDRLTPIIMLLFLSFHLIICSMTKFNERDINPFLHFTRGIQGILILSLFIVSLGYYITYFIDNGSGTIIEAVIRANLSVQYTYLMLIWSIIASLSIFGLYFAVILVVRWFPYFVTMVYEIETPFILYLNVILITLMAIGVWLTYGIFLFKSLMKREDYGQNTEKIYRISKIHFASSLVISPLLILIEIKIWSLILLLL